MIRRFNLKTAPKILINYLYYNTWGTLPDNITEGRNRIDAHCKGKNIDFSYFAECINDTVIMLSEIETFLTDEECLMCYQYLFNSTNNFDTADFHTNFISFRNMKLHLNNYAQAQGIDLIYLKNNLKIIKLLERESIRNP